MRPPSHRVLRRVGLAIQPGKRSVQQSFGLGALTVCLQHMSERNRREHSQRVQLCGRREAKATAVNEANCTREVARVERQIAHSFRSEPVIAGTE
jgi:hypothetical protein